MLIPYFLKRFAKAGNKPSSVPFDPVKNGTQDDDHQSGMPIARHLKRPTRKLSFTFGSGQVLRLWLRMKRATSPSLAWSGIGMNPSLFGLALEWGLPKPVLPRERVVSYTTFSPLPLDPAFGGTRGGLFSVALSVPSG
ncbi:MAG: hypothetical protein AMJ73_01395 [candidate division Zixibacteria bacterium SM1_73]|nr:MAG: hypothetical protein AMJ73_01395 [candidate division Zixibacteria bacterium SM1_73]